MAQYLTSSAEELRQRHDALNLELKELREEKQKIAGELKRLVEMIAVGTASPTVMSAIAEREVRIRAITDKLVESGPDLLQERLDELRTLAVDRLMQLRGLLTNPSAVHEARALLAGQVGKFTLERVQQARKTLGDKSSSAEIKEVNVLSYALLDLVRFS